MTSEATTTTVPVPDGSMPACHLAPQVSAPSLHHVGPSDDFIEAGTVAQIREAVTATPADVRLETYPDSDHAFDNHDVHFHDPEASTLAWERTLDFLATHLQP